MHKLTNEQCREQALHAIEVGDYVQAMRWYNTAAAITIGHKKSEDYEALSRKAAIDGDILWDWGDFAKDDEAYDIKYSWQK